MMPAVAFAESLSGSIPDVEPLEIVAMEPGEHAGGIAVERNETVATVQTTAAVLDEIATLSLNSEGNVALRNGRYEDWIDRVDLPSFALEFYRLLEEAADGDGKDDYLIDDRYFYDSASIEEKSFSLKKGEGSIIVGSRECRSLADMEKQTREMTAYAFAALAAFDRDHPEVFWLGNRYQLSRSYAYSQSTGAGRLVLSLATYRNSSGFDVRSAPYTNQEAIKSDMQLRDKQVDAIIKTCAQDASDIEKMTSFNEYLTMNNEYNTDLETIEQSGAYPQAWECISAIDGREGEKGPVCEAYSRAFKLLCDKAGIPCVLVDGWGGVSYSSAEAHMWNNVKIGNAWYAVDVTWNDPLGERDGKVSGSENEDYLFVGADSVINLIPFSSSHQVENSVFPGGTAFTNGPELCVSAYDPVAAANCARGTHSYMAYRPNNDATCVKNGTETARCLYCSAVQTRSIVGSSKNASHSYGRWVTTKAATCTAAGTQKRTCSRSSAHVETRAVAALGHNFGAWRSNGDAQVNVNGTETACCTRCTASKTREAAGSALAPAKGQTVVVGSASYKATGAATVTYAGPSNKKASSVTVPAAVAISGRTYKVTAISPKAFAGNKNLKSVKIGANVKTVPASAFKGCTKLTSVSFGNGITSLGKNAFYGCKALKSVTLGTKVTTIGDGAFQNCAKLTKVTVKSTKLSKVGKNAFAGCKRLGTITLKTTKLKSVGKNAFKGTKSKMTVKVPKKKLKAYQKLCKNKGSKTVRVKK